MEWEQKADGMRVDEKIFRGRWIEMILLRWYTYNRHGLYLWLDCFLTRLRKVPFQYNTDSFFCFICSRSKRLSFFVFASPYRCAVDCQWYCLLLLQVIFNGRERLRFSLSSQRKIFVIAKPFDFSSFPLSLGQSLLHGQSPWPVSWHLPFFWFFRRTQPHLSLSRRNSI